MFVEKTERGTRRAIEVLKVSTNFFIIKKGEGKSLKFVLEKK